MWRDSFWLATAGLRSWPRIHADARQIIEGILNEDVILSKAESYAICRGRENAEALRLAQGMTVRMGHDLLVRYAES